MFDERYLESAEFYKRRYDNFSTLVIIPIFLLLVFILLFSLFCKREIVTKNVGEIIPKKILSTIQSTSNNSIDQNFLSENKSVKKNQILLKFNHQSETVSKQLLEQQINNAKDRIKNLNILFNSVNLNDNQFKGTDSYGYESLYKSYLSQVNELNNEFNQQLSDNQNQDAQSENQINTLKKSQTKIQQQIDQYKLLLASIQNETTVSNNQYQSIYSNYQKDLNLANSDSDKETLKQTTITSIQQQIDQLQSSISNYDDQISSIKKSGPLSKEGTISKISSLKQQQLSDIQKQIDSQQSTLNELNARYNVSNESLEDTIIKSPESGIVHLEDANLKRKYATKGSTIALIYPKMSDRPLLSVEFFIPETQIEDLKIGQKIMFTENKESIKPQKLHGKIQQISTAPVVIKNGSFYRCVGSIHPTKKEYTTLKYGISGQVTVIKGSKTWFNYYKDILLGVKNE
ncbi:bacteriocin secretion accessory protein (plasmid) [Leuconostoc mesenteroides]|uniref:bacteriocin secretion accessory protein n=1 Tax=Leuconostoc mesenteroides TaxID=1245 RepID=UPI0021139E19|nr:bacteriocin secretion accessory protein [Leuconostoc mesenteroides]UUE16909.1 bacteriocin secretion accessory protein [Leuconostoc mesenteroides]